MSTDQKRVLVQRLVTVGAVALLAVAEALGPEGVVAIKSKPR